MRDFLNRLNEKLNPVALRLLDYLSTGDNPWLRVAALLLGTFLLGVSL